ncbi:hypothetical protein HpNP145_08270 [Helicobacter pylori]
MGAQKLKIILNFLGYLFVIVAKEVSFLTLQRRERFETSFMGAVVGLEAREQAHSRFFNP